MVRRALALALAAASAAAACGAPAARSTPPPAAPAAATAAPDRSATPSPAAVALPPGAGPPVPTAARCGDRVTASIVLTNDLTCPGDALVVAAGGIVVDLGGRTLRGPGMGAQTWPQPQLDSVGVRVVGHDAVTVRNGTITDFSTGVYLDATAGAVVEAVRSERSRYGLYVHRSTRATVRGNTLAVNVYGLHLQQSSDGLVQGNRLVRQTYNSPGGYGIYLFASHRNRITENDIEANVNWGVWFSEATGNVTVRNNIVGNRPNVSDNTAGNVWHDAERREGNHWDDYPGRDTNGDGIGDTGAYVILGPADVVDPYPFVSRDGWKRRSGPTRDLYVPPAAAAPAEVRLLALTAAGTVVAATPADRAVRDTGLRASSIALQSDGRTLYALDGRSLAVYDAASGATARHAVHVEGVVAANRDGRSALVVSAGGAEQVDTATGRSELYAYRQSPVGIAPSYKHNHIFVGTARGLDLLYLNLGGRTPYTIPLAGPARAVAMNGSGTRVYVAVGDGREIDVVDTEQYRVVGRLALPAPASSLAVAPREDRLYAGLSGGIAVVDLRDGSASTVAPFTGQVTDLAVSRDGALLFAALAGLDQGIAVIRVADPSRADIIPLASPPLRLLAASY